MTRYPIVPDRSRLEIEAKSSYILGTQAGREGLNELKEAWKTIAASEEFKGLTQTGFSIAGEVLKQGTKLRS